jgi:nucleoid-associated protein YgaU
LDIYITEKKSGFRVALSMLPEATKRKGSTKFRSYDIINLGKVKLPNGTELMEFSWKGTFPGKKRLGFSYIKNQHWKEPKELENIFDKWRKEGTELILMVTETFINHNVYIAEFSATNSRGAGDVDYEVNFVESKPLQVYTTSELNIKPASKNNEASSSSRPGGSGAKTYTVKKGDTLWGIAKQYLGNGSRYPEIYNLNRNIIGNNPNLIKPGQVLTLPG